MPAEAKPLFRPDVLRAHLAAFSLPASVDASRPKLAHWADLLSSDNARALKEQEILPDFLTDFFCELLGYTSRSFRVLRGRRVMAAAANEFRGISTGC